MEDARALAEWARTGSSTREVPFRPARILMQDFTGVPGVVDLAAMRDGITKLGGRPDQVNPLIQVDLVIDHSVMVDYSGTEERPASEHGRRSSAATASATASCAGVPDGVRELPGRAAGRGHLPPGERRIPGADGLDGRIEGGETFAYPDTLFGTDSHTTMANGIGVLGWGVGGIEAEAAMLGQPIAMLIPDVIGFRLTGELPEGSTATDLALTVTQMSAQGAAWSASSSSSSGPASADLSVATRLTIANMAPEYGATCGIFPVDATDARLPAPDRPRRGPDRAGGGLCQGAGHVGGRHDARRGVHQT